MPRPRSAFACAAQLSFSTRAKNCTQAAVKWPIRIHMYNSAGSISAA